jgi:hypothetical protein
VNRQVILGSIIGGLLLGGCSTASTLKPSEDVLRLGYVEVSKNIFDREHPDSGPPVFLWLDANKSLRVTDDWGKVAADHFDIPRECLERVALPKYSRISNVLRARDGLYIAVDGGEFGGSVWRCEPTRGGTVKDVCPAATVGLFEAHGKVYGVQGFCFFKGSKKTIFDVHSNCAVVRTLEVCTTAFLNDGKHKLILAGSTLYGITNTMSLETLLRFPASFVPSNMVALGGTLFLADNTRLIEVRQLYKSPKLLYYQLRP